MRKLIVVTITLLSLAANRVPAQNRLTLSLSEARQYALEHNRQLINSNFSIEKSQQAIKEAIRNGLPQVNATMDYSNALGAEITIRFNENMPPSKIPIKPQSNLNLSVGQLLFSGSYLVGIQIAKLAYELSLDSKEKTELEVLTQVSDSYHLVLISEQLLKVLRMNRDNLQQLYEKTSALVKVGMMEQTTIDQLQVQVNTIKNAVNSSERQLELATNLLRLQLGVGIESEISLTDPLDKLVANASTDGSVIGSFNLQQQIDYRLLRQQELISRKMVDMKRASFLPTISSYYRHTYKLIKPDFDMSPKNLVGLQLNVPILSSGVRFAQVKQASLDHKIIQNNIDLLSEQLRVQEKQLKFNYRNALDTYQNQKTNVEVSRRVYESLKRKFDQGMLSGLDLINADNNYLRSETDYISSMMQLLSSNLQLRKLYGSITN